MSDRPPTTPGNADASNNENTNEEHVTEQNEPNDNENVPMVVTRPIPNNTSQLPSSSSNTAGVYHPHHMSVGTYSLIMPSHPYIHPGHGMRLSPSYMAAAAAAAAAASQNFSQNFSQNYVGNNYSGMGTQPSDLNWM